VLSKEQRRVTCVHEAGHAVVHALGGARVHSIRVAPEGVESWKPTLRKGESLKDACGVCETDDLWFHLPFLQWIEAEGYFRSDRQGFESLFRPMGVLPAMRRELRARLCAALAGPIAEMLVLGEKVFVEVGGVWDPTHDIQRATSYSLLLPWRNEFEHLAELTERVLKNPNVWSNVITLADRLEVVGDMCDVDEFLPKSIRNWPPSPRERSVPFFLSAA
jgi:hypothetical protein